LQRCRRNHIIKSKGNLQRYRLKLTRCMQTENVPTSFTSRVVSVGFIRESTHVARRLSHTHTHTHTHLSKATGRTGTAGPVSKRASPSGLTDADMLRLAVCFAVTWIRRRLGTTRGSRSCSRPRLSIPSPARRSTPTPSATRRPPRNRRASTQRQVSLSPPRPSSPSSFVF